MIDFFAAHWRHYIDHLAPLWIALPVEERGTFYVAGPGLTERALDLGVPVTVGGMPPLQGPPIVIAGSRDLQYLGQERRIALVEHGAGQSYVLDPTQDGVANYSGGPGRERISLMLCPSARVAAKNAERYPSCALPVTGPAHLDRWYRPVPEEQTAGIGFAFHWECPLVPETRTAFPHWARAVQALSEQTLVTVHAHPRIEQQIRAWCSNSGVFWGDYETIFTADCLYVDNSSIACEYAAVTGRPVGLLDAPWYRRDVEHGGRFWDWTRAGVPHYGEPEELLARPTLPGTGVPALTRWAYDGRLDGHAAARGARALLDWA